MKVIRNTRYTYPFIIQQIDNRTYVYCNYFSEYSFYSRKTIRKHNYRNYDVRSLNYKIE